MDTLAILNVPTAAPPKQASGPAPAQQQATDKPGTNDFATELNRQIAASDDTNPGPGRDAGKGRETGESAPETETTEHQPVEGQSATSGREAEADRLALMAQLVAAAMAPASDAAAQAAPAAGGSATAAGQSAVSAAANASAAATADSAINASTAAGIPAGTMANSAQAAVPSQAAMPATDAGVAAPASTATETVSAQSQQPAGTPNNAVTAESAAATAPGASAAAQVQAAPVMAAEAETTTAPATVATTGAKVANPGKDRPGKANVDGQTADEPAQTTAASAAPVVTRQAVQAPDNGSTTANSDAGSELGKSSEAAKSRPATKDAVAPTATQAQGDRVLTGDELARLTGQRADTTGSGVADVNDKGTLPQPVANSVIDQLVSGAKMLRQGPVTEMRLQLKPEFLGRVDLKVTMESGVLSARIVVADPQVKAAIEANLSQLKQDLAQQGIALQGMTVGLGGGRNQQTGDPQQSAFQRHEPQYQIGRTGALSSAVASASRSGGSGHRLDLVL